MVEPKVRSHSLVDLAVDRPVAVSMLVIAIGVFGWVSLSKLSTTLLPKISYPSLTVRTEYEGSAPSEVEELITKPLESNLAVVSNLVSYRSISRAGVSDVILEFEWDTDMKFAAQDVREKVDFVRPFLPQDVKKPLLLKYDPTLDPVLRIGLYGDSDLARMRFYAEERIEKKLESIPGVAAVKVRGGFETEVRISIDERSLRELGVSVDLIRQRLQEENVNLASGILREGDTEYLVRTLNEFRTIDEIRGLVVTTRGDRLIHLGDLAQVARADKEPDITTRINGRPSVEISIFKEDSANLVTVAADVKAAVFGADWRRDMKGGEVTRRLEIGPEVPATGGGPGMGGPKKAAARLVDSLPRDTRVRLLSDQSTFIESSIDEVASSAWYGAFFAILVLLVFLRNPLATAIIGLSIPISVIATFGPMFRFGVSLNVMSLGGLALGTGMLVDASIVVLEAIDRRRRGGAGQRDAAVDGTKEVAGAVLASVLTTIAVFFPIVFVEGVAGEIFGDQSLTVVFSLIASLLVAIFFIPVLCARRVFAGLLSPSTSASGGARILGGNPFGVLRRIWSRMRAWQAWRTARTSLSRRAWMTLALPIGLAQLLHLAWESSYKLVWSLGVLLSAVIGVTVRIVYFGSARLLRPFGRAFDRVWSLGESLYSRIIGLALRVRLLVVLAAVALMAVTWPLLDRIGLDLIPEMHSGEIIVEAPQPVGASLATTSSVCARLEARIDEAWRAGRIDILGHSSAVGVARDEIAPPGEGPHTAKIRLTIPKRDDMAAAEAETIAAIRREFSDLPEVGQLAFTSPKLFTFANPLEIQVRGDRIEQIEALGRELGLQLSKEDFLQDMESTVHEGSPEFVIEYDRVRLAERGLTLGRAAGMLRDKVKGTIPTHFSVPEESRKIDVLVKIPEESIGSMTNLESLDVSGETGRPVLLAEVARIRQGRGPSEIRHVAGERTVLLTATPKGTDLNTATRRIETVIEELRRERSDLFRGVVVKVAGQSEEAQRSSRELGFALILALILVYIVMAAQFESVIDPLIIMIANPFAGVGAVLALWYLGISASVVVFIGGITLAGIVVNNAIVLIDCINRLIREEGRPRGLAIVEACRIRLRPIMMTTATTVLGLLPMALSTGEGAEMRVPLAVTVIAGLTTSTILTLVIIPVIYSLVHDGLDRVREVARTSPAEEGSR